MNRGRKIALIVAGSLAGLVLLVVIAGIITVQTDWFRNFVRTKIVAAVENGTGGRAEIGRFDFDWTHLEADIYDFVIHGLEPADAAPLFRASHVQVNLKLTSPFKKFVDIAYLLVDTPQANVIVYPDGHTNVPSPKIKSQSDKSGLETVVDLAIGKFDLRNGSVGFADRQSEFQASGENLRAQLGYSPINPHYTGEIDISPFKLKSGANQPLNVNVKLPLTLETDKISLANAQLTTPESQVSISASMDHLQAPQVSARVSARVALDEARQVARLEIPLDTTHAPKYVTADVDAYVDDQHIRVASGRVIYGQSTIDASGTLKDPQRPAALQFHANLALGEIGRLLKLSAQPEGTLHAGGNATLRRNNGYLVTANLDARNVSVRQGAARLSGIDLTSAVTADPHRIEASGLRLSALGGSLTGSGSIQDMAAFRFSGDLHNFDIARVTAALHTSKLAYDGVVSGPVQAEGNLKNSSDLVARASLAIAPGQHGVPVSGRLAVDYNGRGDTVTIARSYLQLPHTRVDISGSLGQQIQAHIVSRDLNDFRPVAPSLPVTLRNGGEATVNAIVSRTLSAPRIAAQVRLTGFAAGGRQFNGLSADLTASPSGATVSRGVLSRGALQARFSGSVGMRNWKPGQNQPLRLEATVRNADMADVLALAGQSNVPVTGALTADVHVAGTVGSPQGNADLAVVNGTIENEPFDRLAAHAVMTDRSIDVPALELVAGVSRIDATASYRHAVNDLRHGSLRAHVASNQVQLAQFQGLLKDRPGLRGVLTLNADAAADVAGSDVQVTNLNANLAARGLQMEGKSLGDLTAAATSAGSSIHYNLESDFAGSTIRVNGQSLLTGNHETTAAAQVANLPIDRVLAIAGQRDLPVSGTLAMNAQVSGTLQDPQANAGVTITRGSAYQEPFDRLQTTVRYTNRSLDVPAFRLEAGPSWIEANASFAHPANDLNDGQLRFQVRSNDVQLARIHTLQQSKPGIGGVVQLAAAGAATLHNSTPGFSTLDASVSARALSVNREPLGDLTATAETSGATVNFNLTSNLGHADIRGNGSMQITGDHAVDAHLTFANVTYAGLRPLLGGTKAPIDATVDGNATVSGPLSKTDQLRGMVQLTKLEAHPVPAQTGRPPRVTFELHNAGPIVAALDRNVVTVESARIQGPFTNLSVTGTAALGNPQSLNLRADGNIKLDLLEAFSPDIFSAGNIVLNAAVTGTTGNPVVNGRLQLQNASFNMTSLPNGISNAKGTVAFNGTEAVIQNITGETGGGKLTFSGFAAYGGPEMQFRLQAAADRVHVTAPENVTTELSARLTLAGVTSRSLLSGNVTVEEVALHSHSDIGSILTQAATPPAVQTESTGLVAGIRFDVRIATASNAQFRTTLTEDLKADANLTLRGTVDNPGMLGRVTVTQGDVVFFGSKYSIDQGTVSFFNPQRINPVLNIDLATTVQGIDVSLSVTGPIDRMKLSYRSDPPMLFSDLVSLLASGKVPTTDPVLAARQPVAPQQSFEQAGASTLLGQAVANPVTGRLQRLFGVSQLKIDPQITGGSFTPQATLTLQQQITRDITFTYITDVSSSNPEVVRVEWAINPQWSAIAQRDIYGMFDLDFFYKKRFH
jgi:translocation and assembly module TamB